MNKLAIATCVLGLMALATTGQALSQCLELLANKVAPFSVPKPILDYVNWLDATLKVDSQNKWIFEDISKYDSAPEFPFESCMSYGSATDPEIGNLLEGHEECWDRLRPIFELNDVESGEFKQTFKEASANEVLAQFSKVAIACQYFQADESVEAEEEDHIAPATNGQAHPPCIELLAEKVAPFSVPKPLSDYVNWLDATLKVDTQNKWIFEDVYKHDNAAEIPLESCMSYSGATDPEIGELLEEHEECYDELRPIFELNGAESEEFKQTFKEASANEVLAQFSKVAIACQYFQPNESVEAEEEDHVAPATNGQAHPTRLELLAEKVAGFNVPERLLGYKNWLNATLNDARQYFVPNEFI